MTGAEERVKRLVQAARRLANPEDALGAEARRVLQRSTGLSPAGVALALAECLETEPTDDDLRLLCASVPPAPRAHVLLSANVFVAAHRAVALALASSAEVRVRASRREPAMVELLERAAPGLFRRVDSLDPEPGDHLWAYGSDETLASVLGRLAPGVTLHAHGAGLGIVVAQASPGGEGCRALAEAIAADVVPFDQRGCLSPRLVLTLGAERDARRLAEALAAALAGAEVRVPRGSLDSDEQAEVAWYRDTLRVAGELFPAGQGWVGLAAGSVPLVVPPVGRHLHVAPVEDVERAVLRIHDRVAAVGVAGPGELVREVKRLFPGVRVSAAGRMQRPPLDGPVEWRQAASVAGGAAGVAAGAAPRRFQ